MFQWTSISSFFDRRTQQQRTSDANKIFIYIDLHPNCTQMEIHKGTGVKLNYVADRIKRLGNKVEKSGFKTNEKTGRANLTYKVIV